MVDKDAARQMVADVVQKFSATPRAKRASYNEDQTRHYFILPLFRALGWDTENEAEFFPEEKISSGFVDFGFYLNGVPAFYLETKRLSADISKSEHMKQAINYAYLRGVTWAVLTDFEELIVFNAEWDESNPEQARFLNLSAADYAGSAFDDLWLLSKPAMQTRDIDKVAERYGKKAKRETVTTRLFKDLTEWRRDLFANFRHLGGTLWAQDARAVDNAVQKLIDRLIFIRSMEDREIEQPRLRPLVRQARPGANVFPQLLKLFRELDGTYNSNLFAESTLDHLDLNDPDLLRNIINGLYRPPGGGYIEYNFNAISADVLGAVYEQYLGFKAQDPEAKLDTRKQHKRKTQGIYYTPQFVVRYIVQNTLGRLLADPAADARRLRVLDPACGSGSFLIEAFDVLDRHFARTEPETPPAERRQRILRENLYGVDLDDQAVEVTRLNLALRAAYGRDKLPYLTHIQHGNSLVDDPAVAGETAFNWQHKFPEVMEAGGFDVVLGNPPYVRQETLGAAFKDYAAAHYATYAGTADLYVYFIEKGISLLRPGGLYSIIVANKWMRANYGRALRRWLKGQMLEEIIDFGDLPVFQDAVTYPCILRVGKPAAPPDPQRVGLGELSPVNGAEQPASAGFVPLFEPPAGAGELAAVQVTTLDFASLDDYAAAHRYPVQRASLDEAGWSLARADKAALLAKLRAAGVPLGEYVNGKIYRGVLTGLNEAFVIDSATRKQLILEHPNSAELIKPFLLGRDVKRYEPAIARQYVIFARRGVDIEKYPAIFQYLSKFKDRLMPKPDNWNGSEWGGRKAGSYQWYELQDTIDYYDKFEAPKIMYPDIAPQGYFSMDADGKYYCGNTIYFIPTDSKYVLGILNSKLLNYWYLSAFSQNRGGYMRFFQQYVELLPIPRLNLDDPADRARHDRMVALVTEMLALKRQHAAESLTFSDKRHELAERIASIDAQIDALTYDLYGLTDAERALVEGQPG